MTVLARPFADSVVAYKYVPCTVVAGEDCITCGPDAERYLDDIAAGHPLPVFPTFRSPIEKAFWRAHLRLAAPELTRLKSGHRITAGGRNYTLDFALVEQKIAFELDGYIWHSSAASWAKDRRRDLALGILGWVTFRFDGSLVNRDPDVAVHVAAQIARGVSR